MIQLFHKIKRYFAADNHRIHVPATMETKVFYRLDPIHGSSAHTLTVAPQMDAFVYQQNGPTQHYLSGEHDITQDNANKDTPLNVLFIHTQTTHSGAWSLTHSDQEHNKLLLAGTYEISVEKSSLLAHVLIHQKDYRRDTDLDKLISAQIFSILRKQQIPTADIIADNARFLDFLRDALTLSLRGKGLRLLQLDIVSCRPEEETSDDTQEDNHQDDLIFHEEDSLITLPAEKCFYRVRQGRQFGPFSVQDLQTAIEHDELLPHELIWQKGTSSWQPAHTFSILRFPEADVSDT